MKKYKIILLMSTILLAHTFTVGQSYMSKTINYDGESREYTIYLPESYDSVTALPLLLNFHGGNDVVSSYVGMSDMRPIADTANFIVVYPQALEDPSDGDSKNWIRKNDTDFDDVFWCALFSFIF